MQNIFFSILLFLSFQLSVEASNNERALLAENYIQNFKDDAIKEMMIYTIPASITLAQGMLESSFGTSDLAKTLSLLSIILINKKLRFSS